MGIKRALVFANYKKPVARKEKEAVLAFLAGHNVKISKKSPQLIITIGGDGTVLFNKGHYGTPFFSIGSRTSFICQADFSNWRGKLSRLLAGGSIAREERLLLDGALNGKKLPPCLNEICVRNREPRVLSLHLAAGSRHYAFRADGLLFCTPTGSPAYCYSCGGKEMKKSARNYQVVAISPFRRLFKPIMLQQGKACTLRFSGSARASLYIDGQDFGSMKEGDTLRVRAARKRFVFAKL